jgi:hypothetical protein
MRSVLLPDIGLTPGCGGRLIADIVRSRDNPAVCATGNLLNLTPGTYRITETQKTGFFNTDPGPGVNTAAFPFKDVVVAVGGATTELGNTCFVDKTFTINGEGVNSITVRYTVASGPGAERVQVQGRQQQRRLRRRHRPQWRRLHVPAQVRHHCSPDGSFRI